MANGWIKLHRKLVDWEWFGDANVFRVFIYLLLKANVKDKDWQGIIIKRGQLVTSQSNLSQELSSKYSRLTIRQIRVTLEKLKLTGELTVQTNNHYSLITINNYNDYQEDVRQKSDKGRTTRQTNDRQMSTTKEDKENKEERIDITPEQIDKLSKQLKISPEGVMSYYEKIKTYELSSGKKYKDYSATIRLWVDRQRDKGGIQL